MAWPCDLDLRFAFTLSVRPPLSPIYLCWRPAEKLSVTGMTGQGQNAMLGLEPLSHVGECSCNIKAPSTSEDKPYAVQIPEEPKIRMIFLSCLIGHVPRYCKPVPGLSPGVGSLNELSIQTRKKALKKFGEIVLFRCLESDLISCRRAAFRWFQPGRRPAILQSIIQGVPWHRRRRPGLQGSGVGRTGVSLTV
jgi:hypothetical protein